MAFFSLTESLRENSIKFMGVYGEVWTGASQKTFLKGQKMSKPLLPVLLCFVVFTNHLFPPYTSKILSGVLLVIWVFSFQTSYSYFPRFCIFWNLNTEFSRTENDKIKKACFSWQFITPCRKIAKLVIGLLDPPNRKISKRAHIPMFIGNVGSVDCKAILWSGNKRLERSTLLTKGETRWRFFPPPW